jgi:hypothetical protein
MSTPKYPGVVNSPKTYLTAPYTIGSTTLSVANLEVAYLGAPPNICVVGSDETAVTFAYTGKSGSSGSGTLTGVSVKEGTDRNFDTNEVVARNYTKYDHDSVAPIQQYDYHFIAAGAMLAPKTNYPSTFAQGETTSNLVNFMYAQFTQAGEGTVNMQATLPLPSDVSPTDASLGLVSFLFVWKPVAGSNNVKWAAYGKLFPDGTALDTAFALIGSIEDTVIGVGDVQYTDWTTAALITSAGTGGLYAPVKFMRIAPSGTDCTGDAQLLGVWVRYIRTKAGAP